MIVVHKLWICYPFRLVASLIQQKIRLFRTRLCENLAAVGNNIEGSEDLGEDNEAAAEAITCHFVGDSTTLCACTDKQDPKKEVRRYLYLAYR